MQTLQIGTYLQGGRYRIEKVLGSGGFGITYLSRHIELDSLVCIKEFFWKEHFERRDHSSFISSGTTANKEIADKLRSKFKKEARNIFKVRHPNIIRVFDLFDENDTSYYVMEYLENGSLDDLLQKAGVLSESKALSYITEVASALSYLHNNKINHLDVKPANILIGNRGEMVLIDFGVAKQYDLVGSETSTMQACISKGYSPLEQMIPGGVSSFSPTADIYALGATLYKLITGKTPPDANVVINEGLPKLPSFVSPQVKEAINRAMMPRKIDRPQTIEEFLSIIETSTIKNACIINEPCASGNDAETLAITIDSPTNYTFMANGVSFNMVKVEAGTFTMGATPEQENPWNDEKPAHKVTLTKNFYLGITEVTQALWRAVMGNNPSKYKGDNHPVENVSWNDCQKFIKKLNEITGKTFRLPTEAEWEYAAKGGKHGRQYQYSGSKKLDDVAWFNGNSGERTHEVATKQPNNLGIFDMSGNVWEWCSDKFGSYSESAQTDPQNHSFWDLDYVARGGSWNCDARRCRSSCRSGWGPGGREANQGLRLALSEE
jgi:formylglycine-generating enzyme required for sulfatase activity/predicted Ser/Thr protein kinase